MPIIDPRDRFFYPRHTPMKDKYNLKNSSGNYPFHLIIVKHVLKNQTLYLRGFTHILALFAVTINIE